jgi:hypothetical protein
MEMEVRSCCFESYNLSQTGLRKGLRTWEAIQVRAGEPIWGE